LNNLLTYAAEHSDRLRLGTRLCIAKDCTPSAILDSRTTSGEPAGYALSRTLDRSIQSGLLPDLPAYQLIDRIKDPDIDAVIPVLSLRGDAAVPGGCAVLRGRATAGYLSQTETELLCLLLGSAESASYPLSTGTVLLLSSPDCKIEALDADRPVFRITLTAQTESGSRTAAEQALTRELDALLTRLYTEYSADPLGLMREMRRTQPDRYEQLSQTAPSEWEIRTTVHLTGGGT
ncbi:MAG: Ger(x)C family spore germination C-terminal domain-containing protein, partial [Butyricicoccaceae bacterium]